MEPQNASSSSSSKHDSGTDSVSSWAPSDDGGVPVHAVEDSTVTQTPTQIETNTTSYGGSTRHSEVGSSAPTSSRSTTRARSKSDHDTKKKRWLTALATMTEVKVR